MELPLPAWKTLLPVAREQEGDEKVFGTESREWFVGERPLMLIWSQNHIYLYINSGIKINGGHTVDIKLNCSMPPN